MSFKDFYEFNILESFITLICEGKGFTIPDLKKNGVSERNKKFLKIRQQEGNSGSFLNAVVWDEKADTLTLYFNSNPTYSDKIKTISKDGNPKAGKTYSVQIMFEDVSTILGKLKDFLVAKNKFELVRKLVKTATIKVQSNDLSWYWQNVWQNASDLGFSILPFPKDKPKDKGVWDKRHDGPGIYLTKHILECITATTFLSNTIAKLITEKYTKK